MDEKIGTIVDKIIILRKHWHTGNPEAIIIEQDDDRIMIEMDELDEVIKIISSIK